MRTETTIVGRDREREQVKSLAEALAAGRGGLLLVSGEAGIGKTTLVGELIRHAREFGALTVSGACYDLTTAAPYGPWLEISDAYPRKEPYPGIPDELRPGFGVGHLESQAALFDLTREFFAQVAAISPVVIVMEDLHWADEVSLDLLRYLVRHLQTQAVLFVGTYRDDELTRNHPLSKILPQLIREGRPSRIWLQRIDEPALRDLVHDRYRLSDSDEATLARRLHELTDGNPLFASEMLRMLEEQHVVPTNGAGGRLGDIGAVKIPPLVVQLIESRLYQLDDSTRRTIEMASVIGQEVPVELWQRLSDATDEELSAAIERAIALNLMVEAPGGQRLHFTHGLIREAIYRAILIVRRLAWHRRTAQLLAGQPRPNPAVVAVHFEQANDREAVTWHIEAGNAARSLYAPDIAIHHYSTAIALAAGHAITLAPEVRLNRGGAYSTIGEFDEARQDFEHALNRARADGDRQMVWQVLTQLGALWSERDYARTGEYLRQALELAREVDDKAMLATSLNRFGNWHLNIQEIERAIELYGEALELFQRLDDQEGEAASHDLLAMGWALRGDLIHAEGSSRAALALYQRLGDRQGEAQALSHLTLCAQLHIHDPLVPPGLTVEEAIEAGQRAIRIAREIRWRAGEVYCLCMYAALCVGIGRIGDALENASAALQLAADINHRQWQAFSSHVLHRVWYAIRQPERARAYAENELRLGREVNSMIWTYRASADLTLDLVAVGELDEAERVLNDVGASELPLTSAEQGYLAYSHASLLLARHQPGDALAILDRLQGAIPQGTSENISPRLAYLRGRALAALGRRDEALAELSAASAVSATRKARSLQWRIELTLARAQAESGNTAASNQHLDTATKLVNAIAEEIADDALREVFVRQALIDLAGEPPAPQAEEASPLGELSERQVEVLRLVARGLTDAEVAEQLSISPRTVGGHLQAIYSKLGVGSRVEATRVALESGVL